jgi:RimJ/RimL family protein N-acetyltransferase
VTPIETARLRLRPTIAADRDTFIALASDPEVHRYLPAPVSPDRAAAEFDKQIVRPMPPQGARGRYNLAIADRVTDERLGTIQLERRPLDRPGHVLPHGGELEVSYAILKRSDWGHGYAGEATRGLLGHLAQALPDQPVLAMINTGNHASLRGALRLGFRPLRVHVEFGAEQQLLVVQLSDFARVSISDVDGTT